MLYSLIQLFVTRPQLLADHAAAYAELAGTSLGHFSTAWKRRVILNVLALCCLGIAAVLGGVAVMLCAVLPEASLRAAWMLMATPMVPLVTAAVCLIAARVKGTQDPFVTMQQQMKADMAMLREAGMV